MVPVLQIYAADVPELPFPDDTDICQVLWCPFDHRPGLAPRVIVRWRSEVAVTTPLDSPPAPVPWCRDDYLPATCLLHPERVLEYPHPGDPLPQELLERIWEWDEGSEWEYQYHLSVAPGTKVGGWVKFAQDPSWPDCSRRHQMDHLLTIASRENDGASWETWAPVEQEDLAEIEALRRQGRGHSSLRYRPGDPAEIKIGDLGSLYVLICTSCPDRPIIAFTDG